MIRGLKVYLMALRNSFAARMAYRADFFICSIMIFVSEMAIPFVTLLIYRTGSSFPGWNLYEALLIQGIFTMSNGVAHLLFFGIVSVTLGSVRAGSYDLLLLKPASELFLTVVTGFNPDSIGTVLTGGILVSFSLRHLPSPGVMEWTRFFLLFLFSLLVLFSFALFMAGSAFKWVGNGRIYEIFNSITAFGSYPRSIFSKSFQTIITYIIPVGFIGVLPASALLGKELEGMLPAMLVCIAFFAAGFAFWKMMLSKYTSAGG